MEDLSQLTAWATGLLSQLQPSSRAQLARQIAADLRTANQQRIAKQTGPDGTPFAPRREPLRQRAGQRRIKRGAMFRKLRLSRYLKANASSAAAVVEFAGAVQRIAQVHHHGLRERIRNQGQSGPEAQYTARPLLGIADTDVARITDLILTHLGTR